MPPTLVHKNVYVLPDGTSGVQAILGDLVADAGNVSSFRQIVRIQGVDGDLITLGSTTDAAVTATDATPATLVAVGKGIIATLKGTNSFCTISGATVTAANNDVHVSFAPQARRFLVQNNAASTIYLNFESAAGLGTLAVLPNSLLAADLPVIDLHIYATAAIAINAATAGAIFLRGLF